jgi:hypothetical protein
MRNEAICIELPLERDWSAEEQRRQGRQAIED